jgi:hypothetical protein
MEGKQRWRSSELERVSMTQELTQDMPQAAKSWRMKHSSEIDSASWDAFEYSLK